MTNIGIAPPDPTTALGQARNSIGDTQYVELDPPQAGLGDYQRFSDGEVLAFLTPDSATLRATARAYMQMAVGLALTSVNMATDDLRLANDKRASDLRLVAETLFAQADAVDEREAAAVFDSAEFAGFIRGVRGEYDIWPHVWPAQGPLWPNSVPVDYPVETGIYGPI